MEVLFYLVIVLCKGMLFAYWDNTSLGINVMCYYELLLVWSEKDIGLHNDFFFC